MQRRGSHGHGRQASGSAIPPQPDAKGSKKHSAEPDVHYTAFIRLPFARGDFVDPLPVFDCGMFRLNFTNDSG